MPWAIRTPLWLCKSIQIINAVIVSDSFTLTASSNLASSLALQASGTTSTSANPGVSLVSDTSSLEGSPGDVVVYNLTVTNNGDFPDSFDLAASGGWSPTLSTAGTGTLSPGVSTDVQLSVTIPTSATVGASSVTTLTATSELDAAVTTTIQVNTTASFYRLFLPLVER